VLYQSTPPPFDCLVRLHHNVFPIPGPHHPSVQLVLFEDMNTIPDVLRPRTTDLGGHHLNQDGSATASPASFRPLIVTSVGHDPSHADGADRLGEIPSSDQGVEGFTEYTAQDVVDPGDREEPDKTKGARVIQRAARRHILKQIKESSDDALTLGRHRLFKSCKASANDVHVKYRKTYLGPVPHLLLCLDWLVTRAQSSRADIKRRRAKAIILQEKLDVTREHKLMG
jgi:hypothetical protein